MKQKTTTNILAAKPFGYQAYNIKNISDFPGQNVVFGLVQFVIRILTRILMPFFFQLEVSGRERMKLSKPLIIISNHKSYFDPLVIANTLPLFTTAYPLRFISKDQLFVNFISRWAFRLMGCFPTYYGSGLKKSLEIPAKILQQGGTVVFFPEGKCIYEERLASGKPGAGTLTLQQLDAQILPIAIRKSYKIKGVRLFGRPKVESIIGEPFYLKEKFDVSNASAESVSDFLMSEIGKLYFNN